jgi:hypothetical protein
MHLTALVTVIAIVLSGLVLLLIIKQQFEAAARKRREKLVYEMLAKHRKVIEHELMLSDSLSGEERTRLLTRLAVLGDAIAQRAVADLSLQVTRQGSDQSVTLPPHYDRKAVSRFLELTA